jgi:hypothetical protein
MKRGIARPQPQPQPQPTASPSLHAVPTTRPPPRPHPSAGRLDECFSTSLSIDYPGNITSAAPAPPASPHPVYSRPSLIIRLSTNNNAIRDGRRRPSPRHPPWLPRLTRYVESMRWQLSACTRGHLLQKLTAFRAIHLSIASSSASCTGSSATADRPLSIFWSNVR